MRAAVKGISALALAFAIALSMSAAAFAAVVYGERQIAITGSGEYTATDLFDSFKDVMPGDELTQPVVIANENGKKVSVYMKAVAHDEDGNPLTYSEGFEEADGKDQATDPANGRGGEGQRDETVASMQDFLQQMTLRVTVGGAVAFDGNPAAASGYVYLGELASGESMQLDVALSVPADMGNDYANRVGEVDWVFLVEELDEPVAPGIPSKPGSGLSQTGDMLPLVLGAVGIVAAAAVVLMAVALRKRRSQR